jgi:hypothetical protein
MVSPYLSKKVTKEEDFELSVQARRLFQVVYKSRNKKTDESGSGDGEARIKVSELISGVAFFYEKIRNAVDYGEEHLFRKEAISRILKRQLVIEGLVKVGKSEEMADHLLRELIRAGYLPNDKIPEKKIDDVADIISKHIKLRNLIFPRFGVLSDISRQMKKIVKRERAEMGSWLIGLMASEIEGALEKDSVKEVVISNMYEYLSDSIVLPSNFSQYEKDLKLQVYLAIYRDYIKFDESMLSFLVFKYYNANWWMPKDDDLIKISSNIDALRSAIKCQLNHPLTRQMDKYIDRYTVYYETLVDLISEEPAAVYEKIKNKPDALTGLIRQAFGKRYDSVKSKMWRAGTNSILFILFAKACFLIGKYVFAKFFDPAMLKYFGGEIDPLFLFVDIGTPVVLLFLVMFFTSLSPEANNKKVVEGVLEITFAKGKRKDKMVLRKPAKRGVVIGAIFNFVYMITYFISFGGIIFVLRKMDFNYMSILMFIVFLAFVSFLSTRIRRNIRQLLVIEEKDSVLTFFIDFLFIPMVRVGKWLSAKFSKLNVFVFILDFIIEAPFKVLVDIAEQWTRYVKERKEDVV